MTKKLNKTSQARYHNVMKELGSKVRQVLEKYDTDDKSSKSLNEMARTATNRAVDSKALANVRDAAQRRHYDVTWAMNAQPLPKLNDFDLLHRYVAALLLFNKPCPQTEDEIDTIGIFAGYAHKLLERTGTLEDIQLLYSKNDKIVARDRKGSKRAIKAYRDADQQTAGPRQDYDFDNEENNTAAAPVINEPEDEITEPVIPSFDEVGDEPENEPAEELADIPSFDDVDNDDAADDINDEEPEEDNFNTDEDEDSDDTAAEAPAGDYPAQRQQEWESLSDITYDEYYDPSLNQSFSLINDDFIFFDENNGKIGMDMSVEDRDSGDSRKFTLWAESFGKLLERFDIASEASIQNMSDKFWKIKTLPVCVKFWKAWRKNGIPTDDLENKLEDNIDDFFFKHFGNAKSVDDIADAIQNMTY